MKLADVSVCTGCGACAAICPKGAILYRDDAEGFPTPCICEEMCVDCGMCERVCPALHFPAPKKIYHAYAAQLLDKETLQKSTSGGLFTVFAREIFRRNGLVYGCVWDKDYNAKITRAENEEEMKPMRGSKYVWSSAADVFPEVKNDLDLGRPVLFSGLPCQVAGLRNYLRKDYGQLFLLDFFCGGAPSPFAFQEYLKTLTKAADIGELSFKFRDKEKYGVGVHISYETDKGRVQQSYVRNPYYFAFYSKVINRLSCYRCQYRYEKRVSDLTMGDYWGVEKYHDELNIRDGVSALLVNSEKGTELLEAAKDYLRLVPTRVENIAAGNNLTLDNQVKNFAIPSFREKFFETLHYMGWKAAENRFLYNGMRWKLFVKQTGFGRFLVKLRGRLRRKK